MSVRVHDVLEFEVFFFKDCKKLRHVPSRIKNCSFPCFRVCDEVGEILVLPERDLLNEQRFFFQNASPMFSTTISPHFTLAAVLNMPNFGACIEIVTSEFKAYLHLPLSASMPEGTSMLSLKALLLLISDIASSCSFLGLPLKPVPNIPTMIACERFSSSLRGPKSLTIPILTTFIE